MLVRPLLLLGGRIEKGKFVKQTEETVCSLLSLDKARKLLWVCLFVDGILLGLL